jgi:acetyl esterase/lipase
MSWALFALGASLCVLTIPALVPVRHWLVLFPAFVVSWIGTGLAGWWLVLLPTALGVVAASGGLTDTPGVIGLVLGCVAVAAVMWEELLARRSPRAVSAALGPAHAPDRARLARHIGWIVAPLWVRDRRVERIGNLHYAPGGGTRHLLDVYRPREPVSGAPVLLQLHGGAWMSGWKRSQGRPLMNRLAAAGWVCVAINYRLSPRVRHPEHLVDCKQALAWIRAHITEFGGDPNRVVVTGGSAGGHLASLVALTANDPALQPGFESVDTSVMACVPMYGAYDLAEIFAFRGLGQRVGDFMGRLVLGASVVTDPATYRSASPRYRVHQGAPPFLVFHGSIDNLVPVSQAREFATALRDEGVDVTYVEVPGAPHAFDVFHSPWADAATAGVEAWLTALVTTRATPPVHAADPPTRAASVDAGRH